MQAYTYLMTCVVVDTLTAGVGFHRPTELNIVLHSKHIFDNVLIGITHTKAFRKDNEHKTHSHAYLVIMC